MHPADALLERFDRRSLPWGPPTGLARLDAMTGGMVPGQTWVLVGTPGQGRTTLLLQLAARFADLTDLLVFVDVPREPTELCVARLLSCLGKHSLMDVLAGDADDDQRQQATRRRLARSGLALSGAGSAHSAANRDQLLDHAPAALFFDDLDVLDGASPERVAGWAAPGAFVCITLPRHLVVRGESAYADLHPGWARVADLVMEIRTQDLFDEHGCPRVGEADLTVLKNRRGPLWTSIVSFQGRYSRFVDLRC